MILLNSLASATTRRRSLLLRAALLHGVVFVLYSMCLAEGSSTNYLFNDSHFHLTNYVQEGDDIHDFLKIMGDKVGRVALFGIPLQQQWSYRVDGDRGQAIANHLH